MSTSTRNADIVTLYFQFIVRWFSILVPRRRARWLWLRVSFWLTSRKVILSYRKPIQSSGSETVWLVRWCKHSIIINLLDHQSWKGGHSVKTGVQLQGAQSRRGFVCDPPAHKRHNENKVGPRRPGFWEVTASSCWVRYPSRSGAQTWRNLIFVRFSLALRTIHG